jgi:hypothetical protein
MHRLQLYMLIAEILRFCLWYGRLWAFFYIIFKATLIFRGRYIIEYRIGNSIVSETWQISQYMSLRSANFKGVLLRLRILTSSRSWFIFDKETSIGINLFSFLNNLYNGGITWFIVPMNCSAIIEVDKTFLLANWTFMLFTLILCPLTQLS